MCLHIFHFTTFYTLQSKPIRPAPLTFTFSWQQHKVAIKWCNINALLLAREATKAILQILVSEISWQTVIQTQSFVRSYISALRSERLSSAFTCYYYIILFLCCFVVSVSSFLSTFLLLKRFQQIIAILDARRRLYSSLFTSFLLTVEASIHNDAAYLQLHTYRNILKNLIGCSICIVLSGLSKQDKT